VDISAGTVNMAFTSVSSSGALVNGIRFDNAAGTFTASGGTIQNATEAAIELTGNNSGDTIDFTYNGAVADQTGTAVAISGQSGGTKDFNGQIGTGATPAGRITLANNIGGTTTRFDGGTVLSTGAQSAFSGSNGGTVIVTDPNVRGTAPDNSLATTTGTALSLANTTIGADDLTFQSISANGALNAIVLDNTGSTGGLTITGLPDGGGGTVSDSGGTIQNTTGDAVWLSQARDIDLRDLQINASGDNAIDATAVSNLTVNSVDIATTASHAVRGNSLDAVRFNGFSSISGAGNAADEHGIYLAGVTGTSNIGGVQMQGQAGVGIRVVENSGQTGTVAMTDNTIIAGAAATATDGVQVETNGTGNLTLTMSGAMAVNQSRDDAVQLRANDTSVLKATVDGPEWGQNLGQIVDGQASGSATLRAQVSALGPPGGLPEQNYPQDVLSFVSNDTSTVHATVRNSTITGNYNNVVGVRLIQNGNGTLNAYVHNNRITNISQGIRGDAGGGGGSMSLAIASNDIDLTNPPHFTPIAVESGWGAPGESNQTCLALSNNEALTHGSFEYELDQHAGTSFRLQGFAGNGASAGDVASWIAANGNTGLASVSIASSFTSSAGCPATLPP
jgi:hypothetical protein